DLPLWRAHDRRGEGAPGGARGGDPPEGGHRVNSSDIKWDERGLAPAVVCHAESGAVLMLAWMNAEALGATLASGQVYFYSRSRATLWHKGETSGNTLDVREL